VNTFAAAVVAAMHHEGSPSANKDYTRGTLKSSSATWQDTERRI